MAEITASLVKELRERTGAGMMECKKALTENNGDLEASAEWLRKQGIIKVGKKADRVTAEGRIAVAQDGGKAVLVEINSETDFVAKDETFMTFANAVAQAALASGAADVEALKSAKVASGETVEEARAAAVAKLGENIQVRRLTRVDSADNVAAYVHGGKIAKIVNENTLYGQPYVVDTNMTVEAALKAAKADVASFHRIAVGEGIEKVVEDYAAEVAKAMQV